MKVDLSLLSRKRKVILTSVGIIYNFFLFFMLAFGFESKDIIAMSVFALVSIGVLFLWIK